MRLGKWVMSAFIAIGLVGCGGGGSDSGTSLFGSGSSSTASSSSSAATSTVSVQLSKNTVAVGADVTATATVLNAVGLPVPGSSVQFSLGKSSVKLSADTVSTDVSGHATVTLSVNSDIGYATDTLTVKLIGSSASTTVDFAANSANSVDVLSGANIVDSSGDAVALTAVVKNANNVGLANVPVSFVADSGTIQSPAATTDASGVATAKYSVGADPSNRTVNIQVQAGNAVGKLALPVDGTKLSVSGVATIALGSSSTLNVKATDSKGNGIANAKIAITSSLGNGLSPTSLTTNSQGLASLTYSADKSGTDTVKFAGLGTSATTGVTISGEDFSIVSPAANTKISLGSAQTIQVRYRQNGQPMANAVVKFSATAGVLSATSATTDANGLASVSLSSSWAVPATVLAQLSSGAAQVSVPIAFVATVPATLVLQASPTAIGPNASGTTNQTQVVAKVTDAAGNPVPDQVVSFSRDQDPSGGYLSQPTGTTDNNGMVSVQYISGASSTATNGVTLRATVISTPAVTGTTKVTVSQTALFIALGTGNVITNLDPQTYKKQWTVYVTDSTGVAVPNVSITAKVLPVLYRKGSMVYITTAWTTQEWLPSSPGYPTTTGSGVIPTGYYINCQNEDTVFSDSRAYNGFLDAGEDINNNGVLDPGNVISLDSGQVKTDSAGRATLTLLYAESYAPWVLVRMPVQAIVSGTESTTSVQFVVPGLSSDFTDQTSSPAGAVSPFGTRYYYDATAGKFICSVPN